MSPLPLFGDLTTQRKQKTPPGPIVGHAMWQHGDLSDARHRYYLVRRWMRTEPMLMWVVYSAGDGDENRDDSVTRRIIEWSWRWGYGGVLIASLYPICARSVDEANAWRDRARTAEEWDHFTQAAIAAGMQAEASRCAVRVAAWGQLDPDARDDLDRWLELFESKAPAWCLGVTGPGDPVHPSARGAQRPQPDACLLPFSYPLLMGRELAEMKNGGSEEPPEFREETSKNAAPESVNDQVAAAEIMNLV